MRAQILNLRLAGIACATAIHYFPPCGKPGGDHLQCPEGRAAMQQIYESMSNLMYSVRMSLAAVFNPDPEAWDFLWWRTEDSPFAKSSMTKFARNAYPDQEEFIRSWAELSGETMHHLGNSFSKQEWQALSAKGAWQNGPRMPQMLHLLGYLEDQVAKQFDRYDLVLGSGLLGDCNLSKHVQKKATDALAS